MTVARRFFCSFFVIAALVPAAYAAALSPGQRDWDARLSLSAHAGDLAAVGEALAHGADVDPPPGEFETANVPAISPMMWAAGEGHVDVMKRLLAAGAHVNFRNSEGGSALLEAAQHDQVEALLLLLAAHADANARDDHGWTPLLLVTQNGDSVAVRTLINARANVNPPLSSHAQSPLMEAAAHGAEYSVGLLLGAGAKVNQVNDFGYTALHLAAQSHSPQVVAALLKAGADPNLAAQNGMTPLMIASREGDAAMVRSLLAAKADVNAKLKPTVPRWGGGGALRIAGDRDHKDIVQILLAAGAK